MILKRIDILLFIALPSLLVFQELFYISQNYFSYSFSNLMRLHYALRNPSISVSAVIIIYVL
jgi:hypothetical protein